ncbi:hypothetical protein JCM8115_000762 [Rhodotorula mucilaginosa]
MFAVRSSEPTPEQLLQQHPAFRPPAAPAPSLPKRRGTPPTSARQPPPPPPVRPRAAVREPPLVERAREKTVGERSVWESYLVLPWNVRLALWLGIAAFATVGLYAGDYFYPVEEDELERALEAEKAKMASSSSRAGT